MLGTFTCVQNMSHIGHTCIILHCIAYTVCWSKIKKTLENSKKTKKKTKQKTGVQ